MESSVNYQFWLLLALILVGGALIYAYFFRRKEDSRSGDNSYLKALQFLTENDYRRAVEKLKEAVRQDSGNLEAYNKLGDVLREQGLLNNAIRIHKDLTLRATIKPDALIKAYFSLGLDYWKAKKYEKAETFFSKVTSDPLYGLKVIPYLLKYFELNEDYGKAIDLLKEKGLQKAEKYKHRLALYKVLLGLQAQQQGEAKNARILYREAIKIDSGFAAPYLYIGDSYLAEGKSDEAIKFWTEFCQKNPSKAYMLFPRLEKAWYEKGKFTKIEELYASILKNDPKNVHALLALSKILRKKGEFDNAASILQEYIHPDMDQELIEFEEANILFDQGRFEDAGEKALKLLNEKISYYAPVYKCPACGHVSDEPFWKCPECKALNLEL